MKHEIVPIDNGLCEALGRFWEEAVRDKGVWVNLDSGAGGVRLAGPGQYEWCVLDKGGRPIKPAEVTKRLGDFEVTYNVLRSMKIGGLSGVGKFGRVSPPPAAENDCRFFETNNDNPASIMRRPYLGIAAPSGSLAALPNAFPAQKCGQFLLVSAEFGERGAVKYPHIQQALNPARLSGLLSVAAAAGPGWAVGYNAVSGGGGSVDHFHGQLVRTAFPVEQALRVRVGGFFYPFGWAAGCVGLEGADTATAWDAVGRLQRLGIPFNLLIRDRTILIYGRKPEHELTPEFPSNVMAFFELSGQILVADERVFGKLTEQLIATAMRRTTLSVEQLLGVLQQCENGLS